MPRTKQVMKLVENGKKRELTYKKRLGSLCHKASQLSTLCGIDAFLVSVEPGGGGGETTTWPDGGDSLREMVARFRETPPERIKEILNPATYLQGELAKARRKLVKTRHSRLDDVLTQWDRHLDSLQHGLPFPGGNAVVDFDFSLPDACSSLAAAVGGAQDYYYLV